MRIAVVVLTVVMGALGTPLVGAAQPSATVPRHGVLVPGEPLSTDEPNVAAFRQALRDLGYLEGQTIAVEYRYGHGKTERYREIATEFVRLKADVIVVGSGPAALAVREATPSIPIVAAGIGDPVGSGLVASLARPGGNVTGLSLALAEGFSGKFVELLKEAVPTVTHLAYVRDAANPVTAGYLGDLQTATQRVGLRLQTLAVRHPDALDSAFARISAVPGGTLIVMGEPLFFPHRSRIPELAAKHRLPAIYTFRVFVDAGGLMSYGVSLPDVWRRSAGYADRILKGERPANIPMEQPTRFELVVNLRTARALGLTIPRSILLRADHVVE